MHPSWLNAHPFHPPPLSHQARTADLEALNRSQAALVAMLERRARMLEAVLGEMRVAAVDGGGAERRPPPDASSKPLHTRSPLRVWEETSEVSDVAAAATRVAVAADGRLAAANAPAGEVLASGRGRGRRGSWAGPRRGDTPPPPALAPSRRVVTVSASVLRGKAVGGGHAAGRSTAVAAGGASPRAYSSPHPKQAKTPPGGAAPGSSVVLKALATAVVAAEAPAAVAADTAVAAVAAGATVPAGPSSPLAERTPPASPTQAQAKTSSPTAPPLPHIPTPPSKPVVAARPPSPAARPPLGPLSLNSPHQPRPTISKAAAKVAAAANRRLKRAWV